MEAARSPERLPGIGLLEQTPMILEKLLLAVPPEMLEWKSSAERWSVSEVLGHLAETEETFRERTRRMIEEDLPSLESYEQNASYAAGNYSGRPAREQLKRFCHERDPTIAWLRSLPAGVVTRTGRHAGLGQITGGGLMIGWAFYGLGHIRQMAELYRARAFY